jgi:DNA-binding protein H-NS
LSILLKPTLDNIIKETEYKTLFTLTHNAKGKVLFMSNVDISNLSVAELEKLKGSIDSAIANRRDTELLTLRQAIDDMLEEAGFTLDDILQVRSVKKRAVKAKYSNPSNPDETWSGRGRKPIWVQNWVNAGNELNDCLIPE